MKKLALSFILIILISHSNLVVAQRHMEKLNRGLVAVRTSTSSVFLSWRVLGSDPDNVAFNLYRDGVKITATPITTSSNYTDANSGGTTYTVKPVLGGIETGESNSASIWTNAYLDVSMNIPAAMTMPDATTCTYSPNDCSVGDVDGDGQYEIVVKWEPSNAKDNSQSGYTGDVFIDVYKLNGTQLCRIDLGKNIRAGAHYTDFEVEDFDGDGKSEIACKTAPGTVDGLGNFLSKGPAATDNDAADYRTTGGYILTGPEYLSVFSGLTGAELATANYNPPRGTVSAWGDSYGNRVDRFLACSAYLDGLHPSIVMCRGYYTRTVLAAWDFRNGALTQRWIYDSNSPNGANAAGQGNHNLSVGDVDNDGKDEIIYGASAFDDNGRCMYSTNLGHGDAMHLTDLDPDRKGLEVWEVHESAGSAYGYEMHDAKTGAVLWGTFTGSDNGRGLAANISNTTRGFEMWSASGPAVYDPKGNAITTSKPSMNFRIYWDGDLQDELLDGTSITKYGASTLLSATGCSSNNSTKSTPNLSADLLGDWREEVIFRTADNTKLRIFTTTTITPNKLYTLMHDAQYRTAIAWQNTGYNQPPHCGFYIGDDMDTAPVSAIYDNDKRWKAGSTWDNNATSTFTDSLGLTSTFKNGDKVLFDLTAGAAAAVTVVGNLTPKRVKVNSPYNVTLSGTGTLNGDMDLKKIGAGSLTLNNNNSFTGTTTVWDGDFYNNGVLANSDVATKSFVKLAGSGTFGGNVTLGNNSSINPGNAIGEASKLTFIKGLTEAGTVSYTFDLIMNLGAVSSNDTLLIAGDWKMVGKNTFTINVINGTLPVGDYTLARCAGTFTGDLSKVKVLGIPATVSYSIDKINENIILHVKAPSTLVWAGSVDAKWDNGKTTNWNQNSDVKSFISNDSVVFNDEAIIRSVVINESVIPSSLTVDGTSNYTFSGSGAIEGIGNVTKNGTGTLVIATTNKYTGKTIINGGTITIGSLGNAGGNSALGAASILPANIQLNGGKLNITGASGTTNRGFTMGQNDGTIAIGNSTAVFTTSGKITGPGKLIKDGPGRLGLTAANDYLGGTLIKGGAIGLLTDAANVSALGSDTITFQNGLLFMFDSNTTDNTSNWKISVPKNYSGTLNTDGKSTIGGSITGGGTLNYYTNFTGNLLTSDVSQFTGLLNVTTDADGGSFVVYNTKGYANAKINLNSLVTMMYRTTANITIPVGDLTGSTNSILGAGGAGACTITWEVGARNANSVFSGIISDTQFSGTGAVAAIKKVGTGTWTLTNSNTYSGGTTINEGTLMVSNITGSGLGTGITIVNAGGTLAGTGIFSGAITVNDGGILSPANGTGTITANSNVTIATGGILAIDIDKTNAKNDLVSTTGTLAMAGKLQITALNGTTFAAGDVFKIVNGTGTGTPSEIIPAIPADGLSWDLSEFATTGTIKVIVSTGLENNEINSRIFPNPFDKNLTIQLDNNVTDLNVSLYSLIGETVYTNDFNGTNQVDLNLENVKKGIYLLRIKADNKLITKKIVKE